MKFRLFIIIFFYSTTQFYGQKLTVELKSRLNKIENYVESIKSSNKYSESISDGYIIDENNFDANGGFSSYEYFLPDKKELFRFEYLANTNVNLTENYFYEKNHLVYAESEVKYPNGKKEFTKIYLQNGKLIYEQKSEFENAENLIRKGNNYIKEFLNR